MRIAIDLTSLSYHMSGIERYAACMTEEILKLDLDNEYLLVFRNEIYFNFKTYIDNKRIKAVVLQGNKKVVFLQLILPLALYKIKADKYIFFAFTSPVLLKKRGIINTIHDMGAWDSADSMTCLQKLYWRFTYRVSAKASERIITVSEFSKDRINKILKYPRDKIHVIYSAVYEGITRNYNHSFKDIKEKYHLPNKYIMTLSTLEPRKNMELLLKSYTDIQEKVDYDLVLVGRKGWKMDKVLKEYNSKERIHITGFVEDEDVAAIYSNAICFIFPSLYEGFGLPPIEALALGTPVVAADAASLPEILMDRAVFFKSNDMNSLKDILENLKSNIEAMPNSLNAFQKKNYNFKTSANKVLRMIGD